MNWVEKWDVVSETSGNTYVVSKSDRGEFGCSCPAWTFQRKQCKHIQKIRSDLIVLQSVAAGVLQRKNVSVVNEPRGDGRWYL